MTVRENVELALLAHARRDGLPFEVQPGPWHERSEALLARAGIAALADVHCATLAYADVKRVEFALALANEPRLLLMDEPAAGMAHATRGDLMRLAVELARRDRLAVLFT